MKSKSLYRVLLMAVLVAVVSGAWTHRLDAYADQQATDGLKRALTTFAVARAMGAMLSFAEGTEVAAQPGGIGVTTAPGKLLRPVNDLVDKFADMMLLASVAFGMQLLLLKFGGHVLVAATLSIAMLLWVAQRWRGGEGRAFRWLAPALVVLLLVRFAVPLASLASEGAYRAIMKPSYDTALASISSSIDMPPAVPAGQEESPRSIWDRLKALKDKGLKAGEKAKALGEKVEALTARIVELIAIFAVQTILMPLAFLWLCLRIARASTTAALRTQTGPAASPARP